MQITMVDKKIYIQTLEETEILNVIEGPGSCQTHIGRREGVDIIIISDPSSGCATVIEPCSVDDEYGGSIHDHARRIMEQDGALPV